MKTIHDWQLGAREMNNDDVLVKTMEAEGVRYILLAFQNREKDWVCSIMNCKTLKLEWWSQKDKVIKEDLQQTTRYCDKVFKEMLADGKLGPVQLEVPGTGASNGVQAALSAL